MRFAQAILILMIATGCSPLANSVPKADLVFDGDEVLVDLPPHDLTEDSWNHLVMEEVIEAQTSWLSSGDSVATSSSPVRERTKWPSRTLTEAELETLRADGILPLVRFEADQRPQEVRVWVRSASQSNDTSASLQGISHPEAILARASSQSDVWSISFWDSEGVPLTHESLSSVSTITVEIAPSPGAEIQWIRSEEQ